METTSQTTQPLLAFNPELGKGTGLAMESDEELSDSGGGNRLICRACGQLITWQRARMEMEGKWNHVFFNPYGHVFEVGCFRIAPGCMTLGEPTTDFTWFSGYVWQQAVCSGCGGHLGWRYTSESGESGFHGLILNLLAEEDSPE